MDARAELIEKWKAKGYSPQLATQIVDDSAEVFGSPAPETPRVKVGQRVQILQRDSTVFERARDEQRPNVTPGVPHWIYAVVLETLGGQLAMVAVTHPGNFEDGLHKVVTPAEYRTEEDLQQQLTELPEKPTDAKLIDARRSLKVQIAKLQEK